MDASIAQIPVNQKFVIYLDDESDYIIQGMADKKYLITHGSTLSEAVQEMADLIVLDSKRPREADKSEGSLPAGFVVPELQQAVGGEKRITGMKYQEYAIKLFFGMAFGYFFNGLYTNSTWKLSLAFMFLLLAWGYREMNLGWAKDKKSWKFLPFQQ